MTVSVHHALQMCSSWAPECCMPSHKCASMLASMLPLLSVTQTHIHIRTTMSRLGTFFLAGGTKVGRCSALCMHSGFYLHAHTRVTTQRHAGRTITSRMHLRISLSFTATHDLIMLCICGERAVVFTLHWSIKWRTHARRRASFFERRDFMHCKYMTQCRRWTLCTFCRRHIRGKCPRQAQLVWCGCFMRVFYTRRDWMEAHLHSCIWLIAQRHANANQLRNTSTYNMHIISN